MDGHVYALLAALHHEHVNVVRLLPFAYHQVGQVENGFVAEGEFDGIQADDVQYGPARSLPQFIPLLLQIFSPGHRILSLGLGDDDVCGHKDVA